MAGIALQDRLVDLDRRQVQLDDQLIRLTSREVDLLAYLAERPEQVVPIDELHAEVWGHHPNVVSRAAYHTWRRLLPKLERDPAVPVHLHLVHGEGLLLRPATAGARDDRPLLGREADLRALGALAAAHPTVVIVGPGGVGKTTLARAFAGPGAPFCDASACRTREALEAALAEALGLAPGADEVAVRDRLSRHVRVCVDGVEHVAHDARALCDVAGLVLTSRVSLGAPGEHVLRGLEPEPAVALFAERAGLAPDAPDVAALVADLDGLPLAIELAATRARIVPPSRLREALASRRLALLRDPNTTGRHASLESVLAESHALLDDVQRRALARLSRLPDGFDAAVAEGVLDGLEAWSVDLLQQLVATSWVHPTGRAWRFRLLDSQRAFVAATLTPDEAEQADRHVVDGLLALPPLARHGEGPNLLEASRLATTRGRHAEAAELWLAALEVHRARAPAAVREAGDALAVDGLDPALARRVALERIHELLRANRVREARDRVEALDGVDDDVQGLITRGHARLAGGDAAGAEPDLRRAVALAAVRGPPRLHRAGAVLLASALRVLGRFDDAHALYEELLDGVDPDEDPELAGVVANGLAILARRRGQVARGRDLLEMAIELAPDVVQRAISGLNLVQLHLDAGDAPAAGATLEAIEVDLDAVGSAIFRVRADALRGEVDATLGRRERARLSLRRALAGFRDNGNVRPAAWLLAVLALLEAEVGNGARSAELATEAWALASEVGGPELRSRTAFRLARAARARGDDPAAWIALGDAALPPTVPPHVASERALALG